MASYFVDTWFFVALFDARDADHDNAKRLDRMTRRDALITHDGILTEFLAFVSEEGPRIRERAVMVIRNTLRDRTVVAADRPLFLRALDLYERRPDKEYSLTDCISMVVMRERGITHVLTNDHHFRQEGFTVLSDAS